MVTTALHTLLRRLVAVSWMGSSCAIVVVVGEMHASVERRRYAKYALGEERIYVCEI